MHLAEKNVFETWDSKIFYVNHLNADIILPRRCQMESIKWITSFYFNEIYGKCCS